MFIYEGNVKSNKIFFFEKWKLFKWKKFFFCFDKLVLLFEIFKGKNMIFWSLLWIKYGVKFCYIWWNKSFVNLIYSEKLVEYNRKYDEEIILS